MNENLEYEQFDYKVYLLLNDKIINDYSLSNINKEETKLIAWEHYVNHGKLEERPLKMENTSKTHKGRFGNLFFINMVCHFLALKYNLKFEYKYKDMFEKLGIEFFSGEKEYDHFLSLSEDNFFEKIIFSHSPSNIVINNKVWFQSEELVSLLLKYWAHPIHKKSVIDKNKYKDRYENNYDLFIHVRLGDLLEKNSHLKDYYIKCLDGSYWKRAYISSDSINSEFCKDLIMRYNLNIIDEDEIDTIMFGSTCKTIILSGGTFSWLIGFFAYYSKNIYYPYNKTPWYGRIFEPMPWKVIF